jgi:glucose 1-dehydrogenase
MNRTNEGALPGARAARRYGGEWAVSPPRALTIVTGASRGIGAAIALVAADAGHDLVLVCREHERRLAATADAARALGVSVTSHVCDISVEADVARLFDAVECTPGVTLGLVNNAGFAGERRPLAEMPIAMLDRIFAVNVRGTILCSAHAIRLMTKLGGGAIVNLTSQSAIFGGKGLSAYASSKAAINGLTVSLAREVAPRNIRVNAVSPGPVLTEALTALPQDRLREMEASLPMGRFCSAEDVAQTVLFLLSARASYVSGAIVPVHGAR